MLSALVSCATRNSGPPSIGEAYVGPATLNLRNDLTPKSALSATLKHGEKLEILEYRHRLARVRTTAGVEGWADMRQLLTPEQMAALRQMAEGASQYPSQGAATVYEPLNMHTEPNRSSPSFWQVPENVKVDVIAHKLAPRVQAAGIAERPAPVKPAQPRRKSREGQVPVRIGPPPPPPAPKPPPDWVALSVPRLEPTQPETPKPDPKPAAPVPMDDWSLIRTSDGKAGWVLTRMLSMAIPDEVAQYAEGHRITSYFALGQTKEGDTVKNDWLWTTIVKGLEPYDFDSFRVFVWSHKHHRYETAYIERNVTGHFPVEVRNNGSAPSFTLILEADDGSLLRKTYMFEGYRIRMVAKEPYVAPPTHAPEPPANPPPPAPRETRSLYARLKDRMHRLFR